MCCFCTAALAQDLSSMTASKRARPEDEQLEIVEPKKKVLDSITFNLGTHTEFYNSIQTNSSGGTRKFDTAPVLGIGAVRAVTNGIKFHPELNWVLPQTSGDSKIIKNLLMFRGDLSYDLVSWIRFRLGTSLMWLNQHGRGGSAKVNNGNGTSTFYYPDENRSSLNNTLDLGLELLMSDWALRLQTYTYSIFREDRRQVSYTLFISYYWDQ
jgi:hypothetical protein